MSKLKFRTKPYPHQRKATARAVKQGSHAFFMEPRCGKTKAALDAVAVQHFRGDVQRVVVVAPLIALDVWVREIQTHMAVPVRVLQLGETPMHIYPSTKSSKRDQLTLTMVLINYDKFSRRGEDEVYQNRYLKTIERWRPDLFIFDESHRVKSSGAVRSQALWRMIRRLRDGSEKPHVYLLTGTPNPKSYVDIFSQYRIMDDDIFGTSRQEFEDQYVVRGFGRNRFRIIRYRDKKRMLAKIRRRATIITQDEAGLKGVEFFNPIHISLPPRVKAKYDELAEEFIAEIEGSVVEAPNPAVRRLRLLQVTGGFTTEGTQIHRAKLEAARDYLQDLYEQGESVVVYCRFRPEVRACAALCEKLGYHTATVFGGIPRRTRTAAIQAFQQSTAPSALVFQSEAGSLAIELTAAAETFFYSLPDSWETFYQCTQRLAGPKQQRPVRHTFLLARGTVDMGVLDALRGKKDLHAEMMRHPRSFLYGF